MNAERKDGIMNKEQYEVLQMEVIVFDNEDVITTSNPGGGGEGVQL